MRSVCSIFIQILSADFRDYKSWLIISQKVITYLIFCLKKSYECYAMGFDSIEWFLTYKTQLNLEWIITFKIQLILFIERFERCCPFYHWLTDYTITFGCITQTLSSVSRHYISVEIGPV